MILFLLYHCRLGPVKKQLPYQLQQKCDWTLVAYISTYISNIYQFVFKVTESKKPRVETSVDAEEAAAAAEAEGAAAAAAEQVAAAVAEEKEAAAAAAAAAAAEEEQIDSEMATDEIDLARKAQAEIEESALTFVMATEEEEEKEKLDAEQEEAAIDDEMMDEDNGGGNTKQEGELSCPAKYYARWMMQRTPYNNVYRGAQTI